MEVLSHNIDWATQQGDGANERVLRVLRVNEPMPAPLDASKEQYVLPNREEHVPAFNVRFQVNIIILFRCKEEARQTPTKK